MTQPFFPCTISAQSRNDEFLTIKTVVRRTHQNNGHTGSSCLDKAVLAQGGGEYGTCGWCSLGAEAQLCHKHSDGRDPRNSHPGIFAFVPTRMSWPGLPSAWHSRYSWNQGSELSSS